MSDKTAGYDEILAEVLAIVQPFVKDGRAIDADTEFAADLGLESLQIMELLMAVEDRFDVSIPLNILPDIRTIGDFVQQIRILIEQQATA